MIDARVVIHKPPAIHSEEPVQRAVPAFTIKRNIQIVANQPAANGDRMRRQARVTVQMRERPVFYGPAGSLAADGGAR